MPNKYSHAIVVSNYEARGLTEFNGNKIPQPREYVVTSSRRRSYASQRPPSSGLSAGRRSTSPRRLRLNSPSPPPLPEPVEKPPVHTHTASVATQIWAPEVPEIPTDIVEENRRQSQAQDDCMLAYEELPVQHPEFGKTSTMVERETQTSPGFTSSRTTSRPVSIADDRFHVELEGHDSRGLNAPRPIKNTARKMSYETEIWAPEAQPEPVVQDVKRHSVIVEAAEYLPRHPPSPPLTPIHRQTFPVGTHLSAVPPLPYDSPVSLRTESAKGSSTTPEPPSTILPTEPSFDSSPPRPEKSPPRISTGTPPKINSRAVSISTRRSSLRATTFPNFDSSHSDTASIKSPRSPSVNSLALSQNEPDFFADLEDLPADFMPDFDAKSELPTEVDADLDYEVLPWEEAKYGKDLPSVLQREVSEPSTRATSFDSVAPPPISITRHNNPLPDRSHPLNPAKKLPSPHPRAPRHQQQQQAQTARKPRSTISSLFRSALSTPLSIPYQTTHPGKPPVHVSVSRTSAPSIPALFPNHKGPWPPSNPAVKIPSGAPSSAYVEGARTVPVPVTAGAGARAPPAGVAGQLSSSVPAQSSWSHMEQQQGRKLAKPPPVAPSATQARLPARNPQQSKSQGKRQGSSSRTSSVGARRPGADDASASGASNGAAGVGKGAGANVGVGMQKRRRSWFNTDTLDRLDRTFAGRQARVERGGGGSAVVD